MGSYLIVFATAAAVSYVTTPGVRRIASRLGIVAIPDDRKVHIEPMPTMGGVAMYLGLLAAMFVASLLPAFRDLFDVSSEPWGIVLAATIIVAVGIVDDARDLKAPTKIPGQLLAAGMLVLGGVQIFYVWLPGIGVLSLSSDLSALVTVLWTIALINAVNLVDGLDGLAAGVTTIAAASFFIYAYNTSSEPSTAALLTAIVAGAGIGFLPHNFNPARIFMGDAGAMLLGLLLASATVSGISRTTEPQFIDVAGFFVPVLIPVFVLAIPLADAGLAILRRVRGRRPVFHADKQHIHHWLFDMAGGSHRMAVVVMYLWSGLLAAATLVLALGPGFGWRVVSAAITVGLLASIVAIPRALRRASSATGSNGLAPATLDDGRNDRGIMG